MNSLMKILQNPDYGAKLQRDAFFRAFRVLRPKRLYFLLRLYQIKAQGVALLTRLFLRIKRAIIRFRLKRAQIILHRLRTGGAG